MMVWFVHGFQVRKFKFKNELKKIFVKISILYTHFIVEIILQ